MPDAHTHDEPFQGTKTPEFPSLAKTNASALMALLDDWMNGDEAEQRETFMALKHGLDEDRPEGSEIADYEVRRELLRSGKENGIGRLDALKRLLRYKPITTAIMIKAAEFWAEARNAGRQSASDASLDADMNLAAQAKILGTTAERTLIATINVRHLSMFAPAAVWHEIG
jgi:hypothetical protein